MNMEKTSKLLSLVIGQETGETANSLGSFGINSCHAALWLRQDLPLHFKRLRDELGMRYVRCHGILNDELGLVAADGSFHFEKVLRVLERILANDQVPFLELSDMPGTLARSGESVCHYRFRSAPPKNWTCWKSLIEQFFKALIDRFGRQELCRWYFEVWNEPDISFWSGTREEYFKLYDLTRNVIKLQDKRFRVGGPATSKTAWIEEFCRHVAQPTLDDPTEGPRCDFISTHAYPSDVAFIDAADGKVKLQSADLLPELFHRARREVNRYLSSAVPLFIGEWNSSAGPLAFNHDECANAAFIVKTMTELSSICAGSLFWNGSDIYEECGFHHVPFHGGYGLLNVNGIPKASFHAFRFLHEIAGERVAVNWKDKTGTLGAIAAQQDDVLRILLWNYLDPEKAARNYEIQIRNSPNYGICEQIMPEQGSAYEYWRRLGAPEFISLPELIALERASQPRRFTLGRSDTIKLAPGEIALITYTQL